MAIQAARLQLVGETIDRAQAAAFDDVLIHVRYQPNGDVFSIDATPDGLSAGQWLKHLLDTASSHYQTFAGGRGFFRIPRGYFDASVKQLPA